MLTQRNEIILNRAFYNHNCLVEIRSGRFLKIVTPDGFLDIADQ